MLVPNVYVEAPNKSLSGTHSPLKILGFSHACVKTFVPLTYQIINQLGFRFDMV